MSSSPATGPSAELIRYTHGSTRIGRTCTPCVTIMFSATRGSAHRPRTAGTGWPACTYGNSSVSPEEASATGHPASDPLTDAFRDLPMSWLGRSRTGVLPGGRGPLPDDQRRGRLPVLQGERLGVVAHSPLSLRGPWHTHPIQGSPVGELGFA